MSNDLTEREKQVVAWLRDDVQNTMTLRQRMAFAWRAFRNPNDPITCVLRNVADAIERGEHLRGGE